MESELILHPLLVNLLVVDVVSDVLVVLSVVPERVD
jgi:hypothetical protein